MYKIKYEEWNVFEGVTEEGELNIEFEYHSEAEQFIQDIVNEEYDFNEKNISNVYYSDFECEEFDDYEVAIEHNDFSSSTTTYTIKEVA